MPPSPPDLVIFDCDGVLVDTERIAVPIDVEILTELGWPITEAEVIERFLGRSEADSTREIEEHLGRKIPKDLSFEMSARYREAFARDLTPVDGVTAVLDILESRGVRTCVASGGSHEKMHFTLGLTGLYEHFAGRIYSVEDVKRGKPEPDLFLYAAAKEGIAPERCAVVEDSAFGLQGAVAANMAAFAYTGGLTPRKRLEVAGATLFDKMTDLPGLLGI